MGKEAPDLGDGLAPVAVGGMVERTGWLASCPAAISADMPSAMASR